MHHNRKVSPEENNKQRKMSDVDNLHHLIRLYSCNQQVLLFFISMLDVTGVTANVVWTAKHPEWNSIRSRPRRLFLLECGKNFTENALN
ncbi:hypothetical protein T11_9666 [Trichinella zimbabwensis]|uniref:PiggyBac transposable element-derived protein domain-containing protein n=1 Tax=Trichinella zimbabwensis TaxID=268475 RepID=A0A0V1I5H4_9BILA|nr:hypothetical protein T11_9666 [Trichinella zimbabwensis]